MATDADVDEAAPAGGSKGRLRFLIIGGGALAAILVIGGGLYLFLGIGKSAEVKPAATAMAAPSSFIFNLPEMTVNLNTDGNGQSFMKLTVALEVADQQMMTQIQPRMAKVVDAFQVYL